MLKLGVGIGRVAVPLAERGAEVHGIDASEAMVVWVIGWWRLGVVVAFLCPVLALARLTGKKVMVPVARGFFDYIERRPYAPQRIFMQHTTCRG